MKKNRYNRRAYEKYLKAVKREKWPRGIGVRPLSYRGWQKFQAQADKILPGMVGVVVRVEEAEIFEGASSKNSD